MAPQKHQEHIATVLTAILKLPPETIRAFCRGNPFDKLLRSFDEFSSTGASLYRNDRGEKHYKKSIEAASSGKPASELYGEHRIPLKVIIKKLRVLKNPTQKQVLKILRENEVILVTKKENQRIDGSVKNGGLGLRSCLAPGGKCRIEYAGIKIDPRSRRNRL